MYSGRFGEIASDVIWMGGSGSSPIRCIRCNTALGIVFESSALACLDRERYALCENCVMEAGDWERIVASLEELCGCDECWPVVEELWEDRENLLHERRRGGGR